jgi:hypothetical protein
MLQSLQTYLSVVDRTNTLSCLAHGELERQADLVHRSQGDLMLQHASSELHREAGESLGTLNADNLVNKLTRSNAEVVSCVEHCFFYSFFLQFNCTSIY